MAAMDGIEHKQPKLRIVEAHDTVVKRIAEVLRPGSSLMALADVLQKSSLGMEYFEDAHDSWLTCSPGVQNRFAEAMRSYSTGVLRHVQDASSNHVPTLEEIILVRRESAGVSPLYQLVEYAHGLTVPDEVFKDPHIRELEALGSDMVSM